VRAPRPLKHLARIAYKGPGGGWLVRVLFTEADEVVADLIRDLLEDDGHVAVRASTIATEAACGAGGWDVVLVSGLSASWHGLDAADAARLRALAALAPIVLVADRPWMVNASPADLGVAAIVPKPFEIDELVDALHAAGSRT
jgi:DNA-binding response OmpR family regulator